MPLQEDSQLAQASVKRRTVDTTVCQSVVNKGTTQVQRNAVFGLCVSAPQRTGLTTTRFFSTPIFSRKHNTSFNYVVSIRNTSGAALTNFSLENVVPEGYVINHAVVNYQKGTFNIGTRTVSVPRVSRIRSVIVYLNVDLPQSSCDVLSTAQRAELNTYDICGGPAEVGPQNPCTANYSSNAGGCVVSSGCTSDPNDTGNTTYAMSGNQYLNVTSSCHGVGNTTEEINQCTADACMAAVSGGGSGGVDRDTGIGAGDGSVGTGTGTGTNPRGGTTSGGTTTPVR